MQTASAPEAYRQRSFSSSQVRSTKFPQATSRIFLRGPGFRVITTFDGTTSSRFPSLLQLLELLFIDFLQSFLFLIFFKASFSSKS